MLCVVETVQLWNLRLSSNQTSMIINKTKGLCLLPVRNHKAFQRSHADNVWGFLLCKQVTTAASGLRFCKNNKLNRLHEANYDMQQKCFLALSHFAFVVSWSDFWKKLQIIDRHVPNQGKCPSIIFFFFLCVHICRLSRCEWGSGRPGDLFRGDYICHSSPPTHTYTPV